jgi:hypothetical protein
VISCQLARPSRVFWRRSPKPLSKPCARSFSMICLVARSLTTSKREIWWIETELRKALSAIGRYLTVYQLPQAHTLLHIFGQYGTGAVLTDLAGFAFVTRGKEYSLLDHPLVQARLHLPPDQFQQRTAKPDGAQPV